MSTSSPSSPGALPRSRSRPAVSTPQRLAALGALLLAAAAWRLRAAAGHPLWLDELYTTTLIDAPSLGHVWSGAMRGVDGNPPLYLSLCWLLTQALPGAPEQVLRGLNLAILSLTAVLLYRIGRRVADPAGVAAGLTILCGLDGAVVYALLEIRTYALYALLVTATLWAALRVVDRPSRGRVAALAGLGVLATLAHSFGGFYVLGILGSAALVALADRDRAGAIRMAVAALPASATLLLWIRLSLAAQLANATPYGWIPVPGAVDLAAALSGSVLLTPLLGVGLLAWALRAGAVRRRPGIAAFRRLCGERRDRALLVAALGAFAALTVAAWIGSHLITPFFVPRYFIPNVDIAALLVVVALAAARRRVDRALFGLVVAVGVATGTAAVAVDAGAAPRPIPCRDADGRFLEEGLSGGGIPVIAESPHAWFPRSRYAPSQATLYPLDWDVVLRYPTRARNNTTDFHIMEILRDWAPPGSALATHTMSTEAILARYRRFLVLDEGSRSWFTHLRTLRPVSARLVREGEGCRLWDVTLPGPGASD